MRSLPAALSLAVALAAPCPAAQGTVRDVDFRNFAYEVGPDGGTIRVANGTYSRDGEEDRFYFEVRDVDYGDLDGDGREEAVVTTLENTGGTGQFTDGLIFAMRGGTPAVVASLGVGDRADGGIHDVRLEGGRLVVERYGGENSGACCPTYVERQVIALRGGQPVAAGKSERLAYQVFGDGPGPERVRFLRGGSGAVLSGSTNTGESYVIGARAGQTVRLRLASKDARASATLAGPGGAAATLRAGESWEGRLPATGDYRLSVASTTGHYSAEAYYTLDLVIR